MYLLFEEVKGQPDRIARDRCTVYEVRLNRTTKSSPAPCSNAQAESSTLQIDQVVSMLRARLNATQLSGVFYLDPICAFDLSLQIENSYKCVIYFTANTNMLAKFVIRLNITQIDHSINLAFNWCSC